MMKALATATFVAALLSAPAGAIAVNVSSNDGSGTQSVSAWYGCGAYLVGKLKSTTGLPVYFNGATVYDNTEDAQQGRYVADTTSTTLVTRNGQLGPASGTCGIDGVHMKVCRNLPNLPDPCGSWSSTIRH